MENNIIRFPGVARLPASCEERSIEKMEEGEEGYTVPWAMFALKDGRLFLNGSYSLHDVPGGTVSMKVSKLQGRYVCDIRSCWGHKWSKRDACYFGHFEPLPVDELIS